MLQSHLLLYYERGGHLALSFLTFKESVALHQLSSPKLGPTRSKVTSGHRVEVLTSNFKSFGSWCRSSLVLFPKQEKSGESHQTSRQQQAPDPAPAPPAVTQLIRFLHREFWTRRFFTQRMLDTENFLQREFSTRRFFYTENFGHGKCFAEIIFDPENF